ncbi:MAG: hypothetical protein GY811_11800 [Myxococcales bacterium]|nr:hypothetical protein [Myxococcales bacterium]
MAIVDTDERQLTLKIVYCGPPLAGKTTNLTKLYEIVHEGNRGRLMTLDGAGDRTLFFDLLPLFFQISGVSVRIKVYTVPGQAAHQMTRRAVLRGADGVVFVADSGPGQAPHNRQSYRELKDNLDLLGARSGAVALITQYNKRDVDSPIEMKPFADEPVEAAEAESGTGVLRTFLRLVQASWASLESESHLEQHFRVSEAQFAEALARHLGPAS